jgi:hypothetical protein
MHIHISAITAVNVFFMWAIVKLFWDWIAQKLGEHPIGQAMAYITT